MEQREAALEIASIGTWRADVRTGAVLLDARAQRQYGFDREAVSWGEILARIPPGDSERVQEYVAAEYVDGTPPPIEHRIRHPDGSIHWLSVSTRLRYEGEGRRRSAVAVMGTTLDVTGLRRAEEERAREAERLRIISDFTYDWEYWLAPDDSLLFVSPSCERITGWQPEDLLADPELLVRMVHAEDRHRLVRHMEQIHTDRSAFEFELRIVRRDGQVRWLAHACQPVEGRGGEYLGRRVSNRDITERKLAEQALRESEERLRMALESAELGTWDFEVATERLEWSPRCRQIFGVRPGEAIDIERFLACVHPDDRDYARQGSLAALEPSGSGRYSLQYRVVHPEGGVRWVLVMGRTLFEETPGGPAPRRMIGTVQDLTPLKQSEEARREAELRRRNEETLREADRRKNEFLATLSHELRNPLAPIRNSLYLLERTSPSPEQKSRLVEVIDRQLGHLTRLVDDLLDVTRVARGKVRLQLEPTELGRVVGGAAEDLRSLFQANGVDLRVSLPSEPLWARADPTRLVQVVGNLLVNSAKFTQRGGWTSVRLARDEDGRAALSVRDNGAGIAKDALGQLFQPFVQVEKTLESSRGGLGLGLALVKGLVELHGGEVSASSEGPGRGAEFVVRLPLIAAPRAQAAPRASQGGGAARRVLVVDDDEDAAGSLKDVLELSGHSVEVAYNGREALDRARQFRPDVVLCDLGLPGLSGHQVAEALRQEPSFRSVLLVALSGFVSPEDQERSLRAGFDHHLAKPPDLPALERLVAEAARGGVDQPGLPA